MGRITLRGTLCRRERERERIAARSGEYAVCLCLSRFRQVARDELSESAICAGGHAVIKVEQYLNPRTDGIAKEINYRAPGDRRFLTARRARGSRRGRWIIPMPKHEDCVP